MPPIVFELKGSGDFTRGPSEVSGKGLAMMLFPNLDGNQDAAYAAAAAAFPVSIAGIPRGSIGITEEVPAILYSVDIEYRNAVPTENDPAAGQPPESSRPPPAGGNNENLLTRDMTFSTGGATRRIYKSITTRHKVAKAGDVAPDYKKLIGVQKDGKVEGTEVIAPMADFTITKRFHSLTMGWFRNMLDLVACTNATPWLNMDAGEVLHKGCDGNFKDGDEVPWTVTGKFGYSRNRTIADSPKELTLGDLQIPDVHGWDYVWIIYTPIPQEVVRQGATIKVAVETPLYAYVEQVYSDGDMSTLGLD